MYDNWSCVFQDIGPPKSSAILRKGSKFLGPIRRVRFTRPALRQANIRENKGPSLNKNTVQTSSSAQSLRCEILRQDLQERLQRQERCARGDAWRLARNIYKLKEWTKPHSFRLPMSGVCRPHPQENRRKGSLWWTKKAIVHMVSRKDLNSAESETVRVSKSPTTVVTSNGEVLTKEEATVYVREMDLFVTVMLLEDTPAVPSLGKFCEDHGNNYHWTSGQKRHLIKNDRNIHCNTANYVPFVVPGLSTSSSSLSSPTSLTSSSQEAVVPTQYPAST